MVAFFEYVHNPEADLEPSQMRLTSDAGDLACQWVGHAFRSRLCSKGCLNEDDCSSIASDLGSIHALCAYSLVKTGQCTPLMDAAACMVAEFAERDNLDDGFLRKYIVDVCSDIWQYVASHCEDASAAKRIARYAGEVRDWDPWDDPEFLN